MTSSAEQELSELASRIRDSSQTNRPVETELATNQRIIARITDGIYREPWAAFRELVANAYDADATRVVVETGQPDFKQITIRDNGAGMTPDAVAYVVRNIGGSSKRTAAGVRLNTSSAEERDHSPGGRPLIGKIGIGLFAVAQLTQHFQIITKSATEPYRTSATVRISTHNEDRLADQDGHYVAGTVSVESEIVPEAERGSHGTTVVLYTLRPEVRRALQSVRRWDAAAVPKDAEGKPVSQPPLYHIGHPSRNESGNPSQLPNLPWDATDGPRKRFERLFSAASEGSGKTSKLANLEHFDDYLRLVWKLSLSLPLEYIHGHPFELKGGDGVIFYTVPEDRSQAPSVRPAEGESIKDFVGLEGGHDDPVGGFSVFLDGMQLFRPIDIPRHLRSNSRLPAPVMMVAKEKAPFREVDLDRAGGALSFEAYLYWNSKIVPKETTGVLIRVRGASGTLFDAKFLDYHVSEQNRLRQITSEIFVCEGLDSAINIDRESFNYSHPHFLYIQRWLHKALRLLVNRLKALADERLRSSREESAHQQRLAIEQRALDVWASRVGASSDTPAVNFGDGSPPAEVGPTEIDWQAEPLRGDAALASALAVVLEAYGVLADLSAQDRAALINDILSIFSRSP